jgi:methyl-accepting chemotaxis protein
VVADEVRNLALRAAEAAKNTESLIQDTVSKVKTGSEILARTNEEFEQVNKNGQEAGQLISQIALASVEQTQGLESINQAATEMDNVTQQVAAHAEESAAAAEQLTSQAQSMKGMVLKVAKLVQGEGDNHRGLHGPKTPQMPAPDRKGKQRYLPRPAQPPDEGKKSSKSAPKPDPEAAIPMADGEEDFQDF